MKKVQKDLMQIIFALLIALQEIFLPSPVLSQGEILVSTEPIVEQLNRLKVIIEGKKNNDILLVSSTITSVREASIYQNRLTEFERIALSVDTLLGAYGGHLDVRDFPKTIELLQGIKTATELSIVLGKLSVAKFNALDLAHNYVSLISRADDLHGTRVYRPFEIDFNAYQHFIESELLAGAMNAEIPIYRLGGSEVVLYGSPGDIYNFYERLIDSFVRNTLPEKLPTSTVTRITDKLRSLNVHLSISGYTIDVLEYDSFSLGSSTATLSVLGGIASMNSKVGTPLMTVWDNFEDNYENNVKWTVGKIAVKGGIMAVGAFVGGGIGARKFGLTFDAVIAGYEVMKFGDDLRNLNISFEHLSLLDTLEDIANSMAIEHHIETSKVNEVLHGVLSSVLLDLNADSEIIYPDICGFVGYPPCPELPTPTPGSISGTPTPTPTPQWRECADTTSEGVLIYHEGNDLDCVRVGVGKSPLYKHVKSVQIIGNGFEVQFCTSKVDELGVCGKVFSGTGTFDVPDGFYKSVKVKQLLECTDMSKSGGAYLWDGDSAGSGSCLWLASGNEIELLPFGPNYIDVRDFPDGTPVRVKLYKDPNFQGPRAEAGKDQVIQGSYDSARVINDNRRPENVTITSPMPGQTYYGGFPDLCGSGTDPDDDPIRKIWTLIDATTGFVIPSASGVEQCMNAIDSYLKAGTTTFKYDLCIWDDLNERDGYTGNCATSDGPSSNWTNAPTFTVVMTGDEVTTVTGRTPEFGSTHRIQPIICDDKEGLMYYAVTLDGQLYTALHGHQVTWLDSGYNCFQWPNFMGEGTFRLFPTRERNPNFDILLAGTPSHEYTVDFDYQPAPTITPTPTPTVQPTQVPTYCSVLTLPDMLPSRFDYFVTCNKAGEVRIDFKNHANEYLSNGDAYYTHHVSHDWSCSVPGIDQTEYIDVYHNGQAVKREFPVSFTCAHLPTSTLSPTATATPVATHTPPPTAAQQLDCSGLQLTEVAITTSDSCGGTIHQLGRVGEIDLVALGLSNQAVSIYVPDDLWVLALKEENGNMLDLCSGNWNGNPGHRWNTFIDTWWHNGVDTNQPVNGQIDKIIIGGAGNYQCQGLFPTPQVTPTPSSTATALPSATPIPSWTPTPTPIRIPTQTATPVATSTATPANPDNGRLNLASDIVLYGEAEVHGPTINLQVWYNAASQNQTILKTGSGNFEGWTYQIRTGGGVEAAINFERRMNRLFVDGCGGAGCTTVTVIDVVETDENTSVQSSSRIYTIDEWNDEQQPEDQSIHIFLPLINR